MVSSRSFLENRVACNSRSSWRRAGHGSGALIPYMQCLPCEGKQEQNKKTWNSQYIEKHKHAQKTKRYKLSAYIYIVYIYIYEYISMSIIYIYIYIHMLQYDKAHGSNHQEFQCCSSQLHHLRDALPPSKLAVCYWKWQFIVDLPTINGDFPYSSYFRLPEGTMVNGEINLFAKTSCIQGVDIHHVKLMSFQNTLATSLKQCNNNTLRTCGLAAMKHALLEIHSIRTFVYGKLWTIHLSTINPGKKGKQFNYQSVTFKGNPTNPTLKKLDHAYWLPLNVKTSLFWAPERWTNMLCQRFKCVRTVGEASKSSQHLLEKHVFF